MPTRRENLMAVLDGQRPQWTPCSINFNQWYQHHKRHGSLPGELASTTSFTQAMKVLGCDLFSRNLDGGVRQHTEGVAVETEQAPGSHGPRTIRRIRTPHGTLQTITEAQPEQSTNYVVEDLVKNWETDGRAYRWLLDRTSYTWDEQIFLLSDAEVGDDGVVLLPCGHTPLKKLHIDMGLDGSCFFVMDEPEEAKACCDVYWSKLWPVIERIAAHPRVKAMILMDNVDAPFYPPSLCESYWTPYVRQAAELMSSGNKRLFVHACGQLRQLKDVFREAGIHGLEGMAHPPLGDFTPADAREMPAHFIYNAGFTAHEQVTRSDAELERFYDRFFAEVDGLSRFIFGAACQTTVFTPWDRIRRVVDICRRHGGRPV